MNSLTIETIERKISKIGTPIIIVNGKYKTIDNGEKVGETKGVIRRWIAKKH